MLVSCTCSRVSSSSAILRWSSSLTSTTPDLDRTNLGNARLQGLAKDTLGGDPTGERFDWVNSVFFFSYVGPHSFIVEIRKSHLPSSCHLARFYVWCLLLSLLNSSLHGFGWAARLSGGVSAPHLWFVLISECRCTAI